MACPIKGADQIRISNLLPVADRAAPGVVLGAKSRFNCRSRVVKAFRLHCDREYRAGNLVPVPTSVNGNFLAERIGLAVLHIERLDASEDQRFVLLDPDGAQIGRWQELTFAGRYNGAVYAAFSTYETQSVDIDGLTFRDEVSGSRRYGLIDMTGRVVIDGLTSLKATGRALLTAETDDWLGLIRPDGTIVIRLDKEE